MKVGISRMVSSSQMVALFVRDLYPVFDRGRINTLVEIYTDAISSCSSCTVPFGHAPLLTEPDCALGSEGEEVGAMELSVLKFDFFKVLTDHECFIQINLPETYELEAADITFQVFLPPRANLASSSHTKQLIIAGVLQEAPSSIDLPQGSGIHALWSFREARPSDGHLLAEHAADEARL